MDGSLRDHEWYTQVFKGIHENNPGYRIGIIYVKATEDIVKQRCEERGKITGRYVEESLMKKSIEQVTESIEKLSPLADFVARINNDALPRLESMQDRTGLPSLFF